MTALMPPGLTRIHHRLATRAWLAETGTGKAAPVDVCAAGPVDAASLRYAGAKSMRPKSVARPIGTMTRTVRGSKHSQLPRRVWASTGEPLSEASLCMHLVRLWAAHTTDSPRYTVYRGVGQPAQRPCQRPQEKREHWRHNHPDSEYSEKNLTIRPINLLIGVDRASRTSSASSSSCKPSAGEGYKITWPVPAAQTGFCTLGLR